MAPPSRSRTIYVGNGSLTLVRTWTCTNSTHIHPPYKSFAGAGTNKFVLKSDRSPVPLVPHKDSKQLSQPLHCPFDRVDVGANVDAALAEGKGNAGDLGYVQSHSDQVGGA